MRRFTRGTMRRSMVGLLGATVLAGALTACGGGDTSSQTLQPLPQEWSAKGKRTVEQVAKEIRGNNPDRCAKVTYLVPQSLDGSRQRYGWNIAPAALGDCNYDKGDDPEVVEIGAFRTTSDRDTFMDERTNSICRRAAAVAAKVPPFAWVTGDEWSVQVDSRATAKAIAKATGGTTDIRPCDLNDTLGWTKAGVKTVRNVATKMSSGVPCSGFGLLERDAITQNTKGIKTPAAIGACTIAGSAQSRLGVTGASGASGATGTDRNLNATVLVAAFDAKSQTRAAFLEEALTGEAVCARPTSAVTGSLDGADWAIVVPTDYAAGVAEKTGGTVGRSCG